MKTKLIALGALAAATALTTSAASAQIANLNGAWRCVERCRAPSVTPAVITQNGPSGPLPATTMLTLTLGATPLKALAKASPFS